MIRNKKIYGSRVAIVPFEELVNETGATMRNICDWLSLSYDPILSTPTLNGSAMWANSSFPVSRAGITKEATKREVSNADAILANEICRELYTAVMGQSIQG